MQIAVTNRLILTEITLEDAPFMLKLMNTPNWIKYIGDRNVKTVNDTEAYLKNGILKSYARVGYGFYKVVQKLEPNTAIGICGLVKREELDIPDIGFGFLPEHEGKGFGYESSVAVLEQAKNKFCLDKVGAITLELNTNSIKLLEKLGFSFEKRVKPFDDDKELLFFAKELL
ncbi:GNAT family N-acetyltransferase [Pontimicrobium sp. SW4]|uniref:GNAT family N-acetyltransferase n=1 Tax=Pontimicrobium sp. SW4 TaxID=3153519 RepID=A0AAU7BTT4_9FLAO